MRMPRARQATEPPSGAGPRSSTSIGLAACDEFVDRSGLDAVPRPGGAATRDETGPEDDRERLEQMWRARRQAFLAECKRVESAFQWERPWRLVGSPDEADLIVRPNPARWGLDED